MNRLNFWCLIDNTVKHNKSKLICIDLEAKLDDKICLDRIIKIIIKKGLLINNYSSLSLKAFAEDYYYYNDNENWCEKCSLFINGILIDNPLILDYYEQSYLVNNPYWKSIYFSCISGVGKKCDLFKNDFIKKIEYDDIVRVKEKFNLLKPPVQDGYYYHKETYNLITILEKWLQSGKTILLFDCVYNKK